MKKFCSYLFKVRSMKKNSKTKAFCLVGIGLLQIYCGVFSLEMEYREQEDQNQRQGRVDEYLQIPTYIDVEKLCQQSTIILTTILIMGFCFPLTYFILGVMSNKKERNEKNQSTCLKLYTQLIDIYYWCLFQPLIQAQLEVILLNNQILNWDQMLEENYTNVALLFALSLFGLFVNTIMIISILLFFYQNINFRIDFLSCSNKQIMLNICILKIIIAIFNSIHIQSTSHYVSYLVILILFVLKLLENQFFGKERPSFYYYRLNQFYQHLMFSLLGVLLIFLIELLVLHLNYEVNDFLCIIIVIIFLNILGNIFQNKIILFYLMQDRISSQLILNKIYYLYQLNTSSVDKKYIIIGLIEKHLKKGCISKLERKQQNLDQQSDPLIDNNSIGYCYCQQHQFYDARRKVFVNSQKSKVQQNYKSFFRFEIQSLYEQCLIQNKDNHYIRFLYARHLFFSIQNKSQALLQMSILKQKFKKLSFFEKIDFHLLLMMMENKIKIQNSNSYRNYLDFEYVIEIEMIVKKIKIKIVDLIQNYLKYWNTINLEKIDESDLLKLDNKIQIGIYECEKLWSKINHYNKNFDIQQNEIKYLSKKPQWELLYLWYKRYILNQKMKGQVIDYNVTNHFQSNYCDEDSDSDYENHFLQAFDPKKVFHSMTSIIFAKENGNIVKFNEYSKQIFGVQGLININQIIPNSMIRNHMLRVKEFVEKGKTSSLYTRKKVLIQHHNSYLIPANKYLKISINQFMLLEFIVMIRPIQHESSGNYLVINEDWEIVQATKQLKNMFEQQFNLLLSCPKLLLYSQYQTLLEKDDYQLFQIQTNKHYALSKQQTTQSDLQRQKSMLNDNVFDEVDQDKQFTEQFIKEHEDDLDERQRLLNSNLQNQNEQYFQILIRIPMLYQRMQAEYFNLIINADKENFYDYPEDSIMKKQSIIIRNGRKKIVFNFKILVEKINFLKKIRLVSQLEVYRYLYRKYFCKADQLKKVIRVDAKIKLEKNQLIDKIQIIKINRFETFNNIKSKRQSMLLKGDVNRKTLRIQLQPKQQQFQNSISLKYTNMPSNKDIKTTQNENLSVNPFKYLINESQIKNDFNDSITQEISIKPDQNLFIKEDHNKIKKHLNKINYFKWTNRYFMVGMIFLTMLSFSYGPNVSYNDLYLLKANSSYTTVLVAQEISAVYNQLIDIALCNKNTTLCSNIISYTNINDKQDLFEQKIKFDISNVNQSFNQFYISRFNIKTIYSTILIEHDHEVHQQNLLEDIKNFQVLLQQFIISNLSEITFEFEYYQILQQDLMPGLYESLSQIQVQLLDQIYLEFDFRSLFFLVDMISGFMFLGTLMAINFFNVFKIIDYYQTMYSQIQYFDQSTIESVIKYYQKLRQCFNYFNDIQTYQTNNYISFQSEGLIKADVDYKMTMALKTTKFIVSDYWFKLKLRLMFLYFIFMFLLIVMALTYNIYMQKYAYELKIELSQNPFLFENTSPWAFTFSKELYIETFYDIHNIITEEYEEYLEQFVIDSLDTYSNRFESKQSSIDDYFYSDICKQLNLYNLSDCQNIADGILKRGLQQTYYLMATLFESQLDESKTKFTEISFDSIYNLNLLQPYIFESRKQMWTIWINNFQDIFSYYVITETQLIICFYIFSFLIYITTLELYYEQQLRLDYQKARSYYKRYFPNNILNEQKRIKAILKKLSLIG
ncbi:unnamed protein product [Paramecium pentaurelia]|uniref:Uncharacterized protein n=1 Tax=Paramecium pentaurelia TaxID=43138 RepID=A0A8S1U7I6_9CILI|nr:unnamed protein product [Paramecium pentaurelia]